MIAWLTIAFAVALILYVALHLASAMSVYLGSSTRRPRVVTDEKRRAPPTVARAMDELAKLGFVRLGETELSMPDRGVLGPLVRRQRRHTVWLMADEPATTSATIIDMPPHVWLETWLADGSVVQTTFGGGEEIDDEGLRATVVRSNLAETYRVHRLLVDERSARHGPPRGFHSMGDYLRNEAEYRRRFARRYLRRALIVRQLLPAAFLLAIGTWIIYTSWPAL